ncbi:unnamed protein product [Caenorhabditis brenneri]
MAGQEFLKKAHRHIFGYDISAQGPVGPSNSQSQSYNSISNTTPKEESIEWWHWAILVFILLAVIGSSVSSSVCAYFAIQKKHKTKNGNSFEPNNRNLNETKDHNNESQKNDKKMS